jgi:hypothetical protein
MFSKFGTEIEQNSYLKILILRSLKDIFDSLQSAVSNRKKIINFYEYDGTWKEAIIPLFVQW